jgi:hypothetical protein
MARYQARPWGDVATWHQHGESMALLGNINRQKNSKPFKASDFIPDFEI